MTELARLVVLFCIIVSACLATNSAACDPTIPTDKSISDASSSLKLPIEKNLLEHQIQIGMNRLKKLQDQKQYDEYAKLLGFSSVEEAATAHVGDLLPIYQVPLDAVINYQPESKSTNPEDLLTSKPPMVLVPLIVGTEIRSSLMIARFGAANEVRIVGWGLSSILKDRKPKTLTNFDGIVKISELQLHFFMRKSQSDITLFPIRDYPFFNLKEAQPYSAKQLLSDFKPIARKTADAFAESTKIIDR
ncbi:MAG: hypothetical protein KF722_09360 [Nitrospira sp.]|nr:hypothetical protein [Nitrospira sp.]